MSWERHDRKSCYATHYLQQKYKSTSALSTSFPGSLILSPPGANDLGRSEEKLIFRKRNPLAVFLDRTSEFNIQIINSLLHS